MAEGQDPRKREIFASVRTKKNDAYDVLMTNMKATIREARPGMVTQFLTTEDGGLEKPSGQAGQLESEENGDEQQGDVKRTPGNENS